MVAGSVPVKTRPMQVVEQKLGRPLEEYLTEQYTRAGRSTYEIGEELDVHPSTVTRWMQLLHIKARFPGPRRKAGTAEEAAV
jgi:transposase